MGDSSIPTGCYFSGSTRAKDDDELTNQPDSQKVEPWGDAQGGWAGCCRCCSLFNPPRFAGAGAAVVAAAERSRHRRVGRLSLLSITHSTVSVLIFGRATIPGSGIGGMWGIYDIRHDMCKVEAQRKAKI